MNTNCYKVFRKKVKCILILSMVAFLLILSSRIVNQVYVGEGIFMQKLPIARYYKTVPLPNKTILYWDTFYGDETMSFGLGQEIFKNCPVNTCFATNNRSLYPIEQFDAVIFHGARYSRALNGTPNKRGVHQKYIFFSLESPYNAKMDAAVNTHFYNWTMTYRKDSDIHYPYRLVQAMKSNYTFPGDEKLEKKLKTVAWFVSNCVTEGSKRRFRFAKELNKYLTVDIYGKCGNLTCPFSTECYKMLENDYKFYLSFENSICADYVTEKLFNILEYDVVPIVLGFSDYKSIAPPNSVINVYDFDTPKALAEYLMELVDNVEEYLKFFEWKRNYVLADSKEYALCQLCELLHNPLEYSSYENIFDWFFGHKCFI